MAEINIASNGIAYAGMTTFFLGLLWKYWGKERFHEWRKKRSERRTIPQILEKLDSTRKAKEYYTKAMRHIMPVRNRLRDSSGARIAFIEKVKEKEGIAYLLEKPKQDVLEAISETENELIKIERYIIHLTNDFGLLEADFSKIIAELGLLSDQQETHNLNLILNSKDTGIIPRIKALLNVEDLYIRTEKDVIDLFKNRVKLVVTNRIDKLTAEEHRLREFLVMEERGIEHLLDLVERQLEEMERLKEKIMASTTSVPEEQIKNLSARLGNLLSSIRMAKIPKETPILEGSKEAIQSLQKDLDALRDILRHQDRAIEISKLHRWTLHVNIPYTALETGDFSPHDFVLKAIEAIREEIGVIETGLRTNGVDITDSKLKYAGKVAENIMPPTIGGMPRRQFLRGAALAGAASLIPKSSSPIPQKDRIVITSKPRVKNRRIFVEFYIVDKKGKNVEYNVTAYLSPPKSRTYLQLRTYRVNGDTPTSTYFDAQTTKDNRPIRDGAYSLILRGLTLDEAGKDKVIQSDFVRVDLGSDFRVHVEIDNKNATDPNIGIPVNSQLLIHLEMPNGMPEFIIICSIFRPGQAAAGAYHAKTKNYTYTIIQSFHDKGFKVIIIKVTDGGGQTASATVPVYVK